MVKRNSYSTNLACLFSDWIWFSRKKSCLFWVDRSPDAGFRLLPCHYIRDLKQGRRRRLRERNKFAYSVGKNNSFARPARAFHILIHFFAVLVLTTTWNDQIWGHVEDESTWRRIFNFLLNCPHRSHQFYSWIAHSHFPSRTTWSNRKIITVTGNNIFRQRSRSRRRRPCLRSLLWRKVNGDHFPRNFVYVLKTTTAHHMVSFIDFYYHFLANFQI